uniref:Uncharacterized protein n=1 Tax=Anguilla anguilla TaxID=7936 RepID=A0A0E9XFG8_ANGAN
MTKIQFYVAFFFICFFYLFWFHYKRAILIRFHVI